MNLANSVPVKTPDLVSFRDPTVNTDDVTERISGGIATRIADKDGIWGPKPIDIGTAVTHDEIKNISEKLAFNKYLKELNFETIKCYSEIISTGKYKRNRDSTKYDSNRRTENGKY